MDALLDRIAKHPDDDDAYLVYADALSQKGDPHGELIVLMHQLQTTKSEEQRGFLGNALDAYQTKHRKALFGELGKHTGIGWDFHLGFLRGVRVLPDTLDKVPEVVKQICELPIARFMRELQVFEAFDRNDDIRTAVDKYKPKTLDGVTFPTRYREVDEALEAGDAVQWLEVHPGNDIGMLARAAKLPNLEWLTIGGEIERLPPELAQLKKLRRLDVDWCYALRTIPEEIFGIETLSYMSMYDCHALPKTFHMGRVNSLLFGFSRARTPSRRRIIESNLLVGRAVRRATRGDLLAALDNNVTMVRDEALKLLANQIEDPFGKGLPADAVFALAGKTNLDKKQIAAKLAERGATMTAKVDDATHVILGVEPGGKQANIGERPIVLDAHLHALFAVAPKSKSKSTEKSKSKEKTKATKVDVVGLRSGDEKKTAAAVAAITEWDPSLLADLVIVVQDTKLKKSRDLAKKLIALNAPKVDAAIKKHLKSSLLLESMGETKRLDRIVAFARDAKEIDALEFAQLLVARARVGMSYVLTQGKSADITRALEAIVKDGKLDLSNCEMVGVPAEIAKLKGVTELDISSNHFSEFPEDVLAMKSLATLHICDNRIGKLPDAIAKLPLVYLDISQCRWRKFPKAVLEIATLEHLEMSNSQEYVENEARITGMPEEIAKLKKLKFLGYRFNILETFPAALWKLPLETLDVGWCDLPNEIPDELASMKKLKKLVVMYSSWSTKKAALKKLLPKCEIET